MAGIITRLATTADISAAAAVHIASCLDTYREFVSEEVHRTVLPANLKAIWAAETLSDGDFVMLAEEAGMVVALATARDRQVPYIDHFHVSPARKGQGIGRLLMRALIAEILRRGQTSMYLDYIEGNAVAEGFYRAMGGEIGERIEGDLFGTPVRARTVTWPDLRVVMI
ncbi:MAG: GNAT family N-acetyltransferase [Pseudomonadota bacterium]